MQKKLLAVAVAGAFAAPAIAMAQTSTVQIYGTAYMEYSFVRDQGKFSATTPTAASPLTDRNKVDILQSPGSSIGFRGEEKLGGGLSAWFQCESTADIRGQSPEGFCGRNSGVGLKGGFGNIWAGRWDTPFKRTMHSVGANDTGIWGSAFVLTGGSASTLDASSRSTFKRRPANSINYDSPNFGGFVVMAGFTSINGATGTTTGVTNAKARTWSFAGQYRGGPLTLAAGHERRNNFGGGFAAAPASAPVNTGLPGTTGGDTDDRATHVGVRYQIGPALLGIQWIEQKFEPATTVTSKIRAWHLGADVRLGGPHSVRVAYTQAGDAKGNFTTAQAGFGTLGWLGTNTGTTGTYRPAPCYGAALSSAVCGDTGAKLYQIRYVHTLSKRTEFNLGYVQLRNESRAAYALGGLTTPMNGEDQKAFATSLRHTF